MSDIDAPKLSGNFLTGKLGPLPVWAWGAILGVGALGFYLLRNRGASTPVGDVTDGGALDTVEDPYTGPTTGNSNAAPTYPGTSQSGSPTDNQSWLNLAITGAANKLSKSPSAVSSVLQRYLYDGGTFTAEEQKYIDAAISLYGAPPQGTSSTATFTPKPTTGTTTPTPTPTTSTVPQKGQYQIVTVQKAGGQKALRFVNTKTQKQTSIANSSDASGLLSWIQAINKGGSTANVRTANVAAYRAKVD